MPSIPKALRRLEEFDDVFRRIFAQNLRTARSFDNLVAEADSSRLESGDEIRETIDTALQISKQQELSRIRDELVVLLHP